jgi:uroporphyrinogen decarboxylase
MIRNLPVANPRPDAQRFVEVLMGRATAARPPLVEYLVDDVLRKPITTDLLGREWAEPGEDRESQRRYLDNFVEFWLRMGYDFVRFERGLPFPRRQLISADPAPGSGRQRAWADEHQGAIASWEDFERYPWPKVEDFDFFPFEYIDSHLPDGMGLVACHAAGLFEHLSQIMSLEGLCLALYDDPALVRAVAERLGDLLAAFHRHLLDLDHLVAIFQGDDMGYRSGTLVAPAVLREHILPWHRRVAAQAHARGLPYFLHSCGNLDAIFEDLISNIGAGVGIDGKHSFEDAILPAPEFQARYGGRVATLGGLDLNVLAGGTPEQVRTRTRELIETCGPRGRYAVGSGNSVPSYVPVGNYLAMVDEALEAGG